MTNIKKALNKMRFFWNRNKIRGICSNFEDLNYSIGGPYLDSASVTIALSLLLENYWHKTDTTNFFYPIPHNKLSAKKAFSKYSDKWSIFTRYGRDRREALKVLIKHSDKLYIAGHKLHYSPKQREY